MTRAELIQRIEHVLVRYQVEPLYEALEAVLAYFRDHPEKEPECTFTPKADECTGPDCPKHGAKPPSDPVMRRAWESAQSLGAQPPACTCVVGRCEGADRCLACDRLGWHLVRDSACRAPVHGHKTGECRCPWCLPFVQTPSSEKPPASAETADEEMAITRARFFRASVNYWAGRCDVERTAHEATKRELRDWTALMRAEASTLRADVERLTRELAEASSEALSAASSEVYVAHANGGNCLDAADRIHKLRAELPRRSGK